MVSSFDTLFVTPKHGAFNLVTTLLPVDYKLTTNHCAVLLQATRYNIVVYNKVAQWMVVALTDS